MTTKHQNIRRVRETLGTGPVREEEEREAEPVQTQSASGPGKKKQLAGPREMQAKKDREEQLKRLPGIPGTGPLSEFR